MKTLPSQCSLILNCKSKCLIPNFYTVFDYCRSVFELICGSTCEKIIKSDAGCPIQHGIKKEKAHCYQIEFRILSASSLAGIYTFAGNAAHCLSWMSVVCSRFFTPSVS